MVGKNDPKGSLSEAELKALEKKYMGGVKSIVLDRETEEVRDEKGKVSKKIINPGRIFYLRKPDRGTIKFAMNKTVRTDQTIDTITGGEIILKKCWVAGDEEIKTQDKYYFRACMEANAYLNEIVGFY
jgi:hypothetical protein